MKNSARTRAARAYQAANPGTSYTRARRAVAPPPSRRPLIGTIGDSAGSPCQINLEWGSAGGRGPHCLIAGAAGSHASELLPLLADALYAKQVDGDLEIVYSSAHTPKPSFSSPYVAVTPARIPAYVENLLDSRLAQLATLGVKDIEAARAAGTRLSTVMILVDQPDALVHLLLHSWLRVGRAAGVNFAICLQAPGRSNDLPLPSTPLTQHTTLNIVVSQPGVGQFSLPGAVISSTGHENALPVAREPQTYVPFTFER